MRDTDNFYGKEFSFAGIYDLNNGKIKPVETIKQKIRESYPTQIQVGEYGIYIAINGSLKKYDLQGNPQWTEKLEGEHTNIYKIIADKDAVFILYNAYVEGESKYYLTAYDHNKKRLWHKVDNFNEWFNTLFK